MSLFQYNSKMVSILKDRFIKKNLFKLKEIFSLTLRLKYNLIIPQKIKINFSIN